MEASSQHVNLLYLPSFGSRMRTQFTKLADERVARYKSICGGNWGGTGDR